MIYRPNIYFWTSWHKTQFSQIKREECRNMLLLQVTIIDMSSIDQQTPHGEDRLQRREELDEWWVSWFKGHGHEMEPTTTNIFIMKLRWKKLADNQCEQHSKKQRSRAITRQTPINPPLGFYTPISPPHTPPSILFLYKSEPFFRNPKLHFSVPLFSPLLFSQFSAASAESTMKLAMTLLLCSLIGLIFSATPTLALNIGVQATDGSVTLVCLCLCLFFVLHFPLKIINSSFLIYLCRVKNAVENVNLNSVQVPPSSSFLVLSFFFWCLFGEWGDGDGIKYLFNLYTLMGSN